MTKEFRNATLVRYKHISALYRSQTGQAQAGRKFSIQRGVKQGDVLNFSMLALNSHLRDGNASFHKTGCTLVEQNVLQTCGMQMTYCCLQNHWRSLFSSWNRLYTS